ncbi:hypothetical protein Tco_0453412 [Tanacetum coccineum]
MTNKKTAELDAEFIEYKAKAKASMDALEKKINDGIGKLDARIKAMKEESYAKLDAKFEELRQLILGTAPSQLTHVDQVRQITKVPVVTTTIPAKPIQNSPCYDDLTSDQNKKITEKGVGKEGFGCALNKSKGSHLGL